MDQLLVAVRRGDADYARQLTEAGVRDFTTTTRHQLLLIACGVGKAAVVNTLLENGVGIDEKDEKGCGPLHLVQGSEHAEIIRLLVSAGADIDMVDGSGKTPLIAAVKRDELEIAKTLIHFGADVNKVDEDGKGVLHLAKDTVFTGMISFLLEAGANVNAADKGLKTPLHHWVGEMKRVKLLIRAGADVDARDCQGYTPLHLAVLRNSHGVAGLLLENFASVNMSDKCGRTPLQVLDNLPPTLTLMLLLDYCAGSSRCRKNRCGCGKSVLMCSYLSCRARVKESDENGVARNELKNQLDCFESHILQMEVAEEGMGAEVKLVDPPEEGVDWSIYKRQGFKKHCLAELGRMRTEKVGVSNVTYMDIWQGRAASVRQVESLPTVDLPDMFPLYHAMLRKRYLSGRKKLLLKKSRHFLIAAAPRLSLQCADEILSYLSYRDLRLLSSLRATVPAAPGSSPRCSSGLRRSHKRPSTESLPPASKNPNLG